MGGETARSEESARALVVFVIESQRYALPLAVVERVLPIVATTPLPEAPGIALGMINVHGTVIPVLDIRQRFGLPGFRPSLEAYLVVARTSRRLLAFPADEVHGVTEVPASAVIPLQGLLPGLGHVSGVVALPDGLLLIQDIEQFLGLDEERRLDHALDVARG